MITDHNRQKKVAVINDFSSFGRCSTAVAVPVLSALGMQCCPVPTAFFTCHTGFPQFTFTDLTDRMDAYIRDWREIGLEFAAIQSGYLASSRQLDFIRRFIGEFSANRPLVFVDPVMGDYGRLYNSYSPELAASLRGLLPVADVLTPNLTEACILLGRRYEERPSDAFLSEIATELSRPNSARVVISGVQRGDELVNFIHDPAAGEELFATPRIGPDRSGTGDVFASVLLGVMLNGRDFAASVHFAANFVSASIRRAEELGVPLTDGLPIEETLPLLFSARGGL